MRRRPIHPHGYARFVGRVGALAVFLGVGTAVATPVAHADDNGSTTSASSSAGGSDTSASSRSSSRSKSTKTSDRDVGARPPRATHKSAAARSSARNDDEGTRSGTAGTTPSGDEPEGTATADDQPATVVVAHGSVVKARAADESDAPQPPLAAPVDSAMLAPTRRQIGADAGTAAGDRVTARQPSVTIDESTLGNEVSPLGTPEQIARERIAMQTADSLPVRLMKLVLRHGFLSAAQKQFALVGGPDAANLKALDKAIDEYALASAFSQQILNPMDPAVVTQVAPPHSWYGSDVDGSRLLYDNPDTIYRFIAVNKTAKYVITGRVYEDIPADTTFSVLEGIAGTTSTILTFNDLDISEDGTFVITVSGDPAEPGQRNHLQLTSNSTLIAARNTLGDWNSENPMELAVHRVGGPPNSLFAQLGGFVLLGSLVNNNPLLTSLVSLIPPLHIAETPLVRGILTSLIMVVRGANEQAKYMALATTDPDTGELRAPNVMTQPASNAEFLANQLQSNGYFQLADDEALVLTIDPGSAGFFTVPVYNVWTITDDYWNQQTSLNNHQAVANPDGTYTMVVSLADPGVANWVSTGGLNQGIISMRFQNLDSESTDVPSVQSVVVKLDDLDGHLPAGTVHVTPAQRTAQLAARKAGFDKRWAPYRQALSDNGSDG